MIIIDRNPFETDIDGLKRYKNFGNNKGRSYGLQGVKLLSIKIMFGRFYRLMF